MLPVKSELALCSEEVHMVFELKLEDIVFSDIVTLARHGHTVPKKRQACKRKIVLKSLVEI